ncbi:hypothetical protein [Burkholderia gladioli]|jgi:hypothetical protein|uniref:hypothetical protein n=1 Tax=Burkholderia gladioli TaxID=28095 RepID=UPI001FC7EDF2|nr:hypothetical protein [Burkholderia gladioli]
MSPRSRFSLACCAFAFTGLIAAMPAAAQSRLDGARPDASSYLRVNDHDDYLRAQRHYQDELRNQHLLYEHQREQRIRDERVRQERAYEQRQPGAY